MSRLPMLVLSTVAAGAMGYGIAQAAQVPRQATAPVTLFAQCSSQGKLDGAIKRGATQCSKKQEGKYVVLFDRNIRKCALNATLGAPIDTYILSGMVGLGWDSDAKGVTVNVRVPPNSDSSSRSFFLTVTC